MFRKSIIIVLSICALWLHSGCSSSARKKTNWTINLSRDNKNPYGLYLAYHSLPYLFPGAEQEALKYTYRFTNLGYKLRKEDKPALLVMIGSELQFHEGEIDSILAYVAAGHQALIAANAFDPVLLKRLQVQSNYGAHNDTGKVEKVFLRDQRDQMQPYASVFKEYDIQSSFKARGDNQDPLFFNIGTNQQQRPNFIVYGIGKGRLFLHAEPLLFTNYFLLQQQNRNYLNTLFSYITPTIGHVYWTDFNTRSIDHSDWGVIWKNPATRYALLLALLALVVYLIFEMKRRQRIIPVIKPAENSSVAFVETIGRLYYNKKDHSNLAEKMVQHFLDHVRSNYYLNTNVMDQEFVTHLAAKSGKSIAETDSLVFTIKEVQQGVKADEQFLYSLYTQIQSFYNGQHG